MNKIFILLVTLISFNANAQSPWFFGSGSANNLTDAIQYSNGVKNITGALNPTVSAVDAPAGSLYESTSTSVLYVKQDSGSTTNWLPLATSGDLALKQNLLVNSAGLIAALSDETGTGLAVFGTGPSLASPSMSSPSATGTFTFTGKFNQGSFTNAIPSGSFLFWNDFLQTQQTVTSGAPVTGTTAIARYLESNLLADDDFANGPVGASWVGTGMVSTVGVSSGNTVASVDLMAFVPLIPAFSNGGLVTEFKYMSLIPPINQGGASPYVNQVGLATPTGWCASASGTCKVIENLDANADIVTAGDISAAAISITAGDIQTLLNAKAAGPASAVDSQVALFDGTTGKLLKASTSTGVAKLSSGVLSASSVSLTSEVTGVLPLANGGTNKNMTAVNGGVVWTDSDSMEVISAGTSGYFLQSNGAAAPTWAASPLSPDSYIYLSTGAGYGSTATRVRRIETVEASAGDLASACAFSTVNGTICTMPTNGNYEVSYVDYGTGGACEVGITINDSAVTTAPSSMTFAQGIRGMVYAPSANRSNGITRTYHLSSGDLVRFKSDTGCQATTNLVTATIIKVGG